MSLTTTQLQDNLSNVLNRVATGKPEVIFDRDKPQAVLLDYKSYNLFLCLLDEMEEKGRYLDAVSEGRGKQGISLNNLKQKYNLD